MFLISRLNCYVMQHDFHFVIYVPMQRETWCDFRSEEAVRSAYGPMNAKCVTIQSCKGFVYLYMVMGKINH